MKERGGLLSRMDPTSPGQRKGLLFAFHRNRGGAAAKTKAAAGANEREEVANLTAFPPILITVDRNSRDRCRLQNNTTLASTTTAKSLVSTNGSSPNCSTSECSSTTAPTVGTTVVEDASFASSPRGNNKNSNKTSNNKISNNNKKTSFLSPRAMARAIDSKVQSDSTSYTNDLLRNAARVKASPGASPGCGDAIAARRSSNSREAVSSDHATPAPPFGTEQPKPKTTITTTTTTTASKVMSTTTPTPLRVPTVTRPAPVPLMRQQTGIVESNPMASACTLARAIDARVNSDPNSYTNDLLRLSTASSSIMMGATQQRRASCGAYTGQNCMPSLQQRSYSPIKSTTAAQDRYRQARRASNETWDGVCRDYNRPSKTTTTTTTAQPASQPQQQQRQPATQDRFRQSRRASNETWDGACNSPSKTTTAPVAAPLPLPQQSRRASNETWDGAYGSYCNSPSKTTITPAAAPLPQQQQSRRASNGSYCNSPSKATTTVGVSRRASNEAWDGVYGQRGGMPIYTQPSPRQSSPRRLNHYFQEQEQQQQQQQKQALNHHHPVIMEDQSYSSHCSTKKSQEDEIMQRIMELSVVESTHTHHHNHQPNKSSSTRPAAAENTPFHVHSQRGLPSSEDSVYTASSSSVSSCTWQSSSPRRGRNVLQPPILPPSDNYHPYQPQQQRYSSVVDAIAPPPHLDSLYHNSGANKDNHYQHSNLYSQQNTAPTYGGCSVSLTEESHSFASSCCDDDEASAALEQEKEMIELAIERSMQELAFQEQGQTKHQRQAEAYYVEEEEEEERKIPATTPRRMSNHGSGGAITSSVKKPPQQSLLRSSAANYQRDQAVRNSLLSPSTPAQLKDDDDDVEMDEEELYALMEQKMFERAMEMSLADSKRW